jgi:hypothetical protein
MPGCVFSMVPASTPPIKKRGDQVQFKMFPRDIRISTDGSFADHGVGPIAG